MANDELFSEPLENEMASGPTVFGFKTEDGAVGEGSGVIPGPDAPEAGSLPAAQAAVTLVTAQTGTGSDPATITMLNAKITEINAALTIINANAVKGSSTADALAILNTWAIQSGYIKPPAA